MEEERRMRTNPKQDYEFEDGNHQLPEGASRRILAEGSVLTLKGMMKM
jgi:hypothetical protein